jgi:hypothetical protein
MILIGFLSIDISICHRHHASPLVRLSVADPLKYEICTIDNTIYIVKFGTRNELG